jgi:succinate dehydrogenase hydrophobic anchor subunit
MLEFLTIYILGYVIIGLGLAVMIDDANNWQRLTLIIVWPIFVVGTVLLIIYALINGVFELIKDYIKDYRR